jgi:hypothetical protein
MIARLQRSVDRSAVLMKKSAVTENACLMVLFVVITDTSAPLVRRVRPAMAVASQNKQSAAETKHTALVVRFVVEKDAYQMVQLVVHNQICSTRHFVRWVTNVLTVIEDVYLKMHFAAQIQPLAMPMMKSAVLEDVLLRAQHVATILANTAMLVKNAPSAVHQVA